MTSRTKLGQAEYIRLALMDIANLTGRNEFSRILAGLTKVLRLADADLMAIQEVKPNLLGCEQVGSLVRLLKMAAERMHLAI